MKNTGIPSPFSGKPNSTTTRTSNKLTQSDSILKNLAKQQPTTKKRTPQKLSNQHSNNNKIVNNILIGNNSGNSTNANVNTLSVDSE